MGTRSIALSLCIAMAATACADDAASETSTTPLPATSTTLTPTSTTTGVPATTTSATSTTSTTAATTSTSVAATTTSTTTPPTATRFVVLDPSIFPAEPLPGSDGASGSGCSPGAGDLPGGVWYGTIVSVGPGSLQFDLACFYFGEIAWEVAAAEGEEANNDYWIVNDNPTLRTVPVAAKAVVWSIPPDLTEELLPLLYLTEWPPDWDRAYAACPGEYCGVWLYVNDGVVDEIVEQYVP
ncbi:MAG: hypothetical protein KJP22_10055 [Acidimicrobiia bacterium]|nr:hypothetical protein [Acidimicrobiia bacterium]MBT8193732.1 hypothetical protein [Acidimicrobiia bacterium]NNF87153.1 hypothetical protein [Acidimicrobiia bacterium]NNL13326.1 hypothetical protein [Acidimicrobiia bacterium]NNL70255.1 hypothetical protein [Acidimicrobiia bacterium]